MPGLVSVIIPVHNGAATLRQAIESVQRQSYSELEIIVVDDGSTDGAADSLDRLAEIVVLRQPQRGPAAARNRGLAAAKGEFIAFLDADDLWPPDKLRLQVACLRADAALDVVLGRVQSLDESGTVSPTPLIGVQLGNALFRRRVFEQVGLFDERLLYSEDHDWFLRAREQDTRLLLLQEVTLLYRRHSAGMTQRADQRDYGLTKILKASLDRRRAQPQGARSLPRLADFARIESPPNETGREKRES